MTDNQFDNFFREKLINHSAPVPEGLWEKIRPEKDKRPKGFFLPKKLGLGILLAALVIGGAIGGIMWQQNKKEKTTIESTSIPEILAPNAANKSTSKSANKSENNAAATITSPENPSSNENKNTVSNTQQPTVEKENKTNNNNSINTVTPNSIPLNNSEKYRQNRTKTSLNIVEKLAQLEIAKTAPSNPFINNAETENLATQTPEELTVLANLNQEKLVYLIPTNSLGLINKQLALNAHTKKINSIIICPTIRGRSSFNTDWGLEFFASPDYALKSVSNISAPQQYLDKKDSSEQMQVSYSAGFRLVKPLNDHFLLKAGFQYSQLNQKFTYRNESEIKTTTVITARTIIRSPGDTLLVSDTSVLQQIGYSVKTIHNRYRSIDIPVTLGYEFGNEDLKIGINAGVVFNISSWYQGEILDTSYSSVPINKVSNALYKTNIGMGLYSSISILKRINDNTHLFFEPYLRYNLSSMTNNLSPYNQRFHVGGLAIGIRFDLNR